VAVTREGGAEGAGEGYGLEGMRRLETRRGTHTETDVYIYSISKQHGTLSRLIQGRDVDTPHLTTQPCHESPAERRPRWRLLRLALLGYPRVRCDTRPMKLLNAARPCISNVVDLGGVSHLPKPPGAYGDIVKPGDHYGGRRRCPSEACDVGQYGFSPGLAVPVYRNALKPVHQARCSSTHIPDVPMPTICLS
jgi:hypothetical protein